MTSLETRLTSQLVESAEPQLEGTLGRIVGLTASAANPVSTFQDAISPQLVPRGAYVSAVLVLVSAGHVHVLDHVGASSLREADSPQSVELFDQSARTTTLVTTRVVSGNVQRLGYFVSARGSSGVYVVGVSQQLSAGQRITVPSSSPDANLSFALYFGPVSPADLIETNSSQLPLTGTVAQVSVAFGNNQLTLVASPRGSLAGRWSEYLPWGILVAGLILTFGATGLTDRMVRRRTTAEALAAANQELYRQQRDVSLSLQRALLPKVLPGFAGFEVAARYVPATAGAEIGGDWYSVTAVGDHRFAVIIGDVSGHGIEAAGIMASLRYSMRTLARLGYGPEEILQWAGREVSVGSDDQFATALVALIDSQAGQVSVASAGHPPPLVISGAGAEFVDVQPGAPLGVGTIQPGSTTVGFTPGSTLLVFTDGLVERRGEPLDAGLDRLARTASESPDRPEEMIEHLLVASGAGAQEDDIAVLAIRFSERVAELPPGAIRPASNEIPTDQPALG